MLRCTAALTTVAALLLAAPLAAQPGGPGALSENVVFGGAPAECRDGAGRTVSFVKVSNLGDVGRTWIMNRTPVIAMDPEILGRLPDKLQRFFFDHECAHIVLRHWLSYPADRENQADCWAVKRERDRGELSRDDIVGFAPFFAQSRGTVAGHLPGPERIKHMLACFDAPVGG